MRCLPEAHQPRDVRHGDRRLLGQQLRGGRHPTGQQILLEGELTELRVRALNLARRTGQRARHRRQREAPAIVARDDHAREQVEPASCGMRIGVHVLSSDQPPHHGRDRKASRLRQRQSP